MSVAWITPEMDVLTIPGVFVLSLVLGLAATRASLAFIFHLMTHSTARHKRAA